MATTNGTTYPGVIIEDEEEFLDDVEAYMKQRNVPFDRDGKVAGRPAPLHKLFRIVMERGGYDAVTAGRMMWREIAKNFNFPPAHEGAMSYQLKQLYYKNLAAYEIEKIWHERPPSPDILEHLTAKGGDLRNRTRESVMGASSVNDDDGSRSVTDTAAQTPKQEKVEPEEQGSASRYPSRLRQQPKPTQTYQPDPTPSRSSRMRTTNSPQPASINALVFTNASSNPRDPSFKIENYEPRAAMVMSLRPVVTPGSNPEVFYQRKTMGKVAPIQRAPLPQDLLRYTLPKATFDGPNIYIRCVQGLKSGIRREQEFALHHLVKVSHERGDKFKFEGFPTLAEALMEKVLEVTELAYGVAFQISYGDARGKSADNTLNAVHGTDNLAEKLSDLPPLLSETELEPDDYIAKLEKLNEATLVIRNMVTLEENAIFLSKMALFRDMLIVAINLPRQSRFEEIRQYALDMAEMTTRYWDMAPGDDLYVSLVQELASDDRGKLIPALRAIYRFDAEADRIHPITDVPLSTIEKLIHYCVLDDDELVEAVINFLYAWTAFPENITWVMNVHPQLLPSVTLHFTNLFLKNASVHEESVIMAKASAPGPSVPAPVPHIPHELHSQLLQFPEPERSSRWLRCCFEEAPHADVTQISIWQAYSSRFQANNPIVAADFIKNVSNTLQGAQAQVVAGPQGQRFIIRGIRPRRVLVNLQGQPFYKCYWQVTIPVPPNYSGPAHPPRKQLCNSWHVSPEALWKHMLNEHAGIPLQDGKFQLKGVAVPEGGFKCDFLGCQKHNTISSPIALGSHIRMHVPDNAEQNREYIYKLANEPLKTQEDTVVKHQFYMTALDEKGVACGTPFMSCLLLTNLARYVGRYGGSEAERKDLMGKLFGPQVRHNLFELFSKQRTIARLIIDLISHIDKGEASDEKTQKQQDVADAMVF
ncbi:Chromatin structure-remodeling complex protein rsc9 [Neophaeococcomyces mojaviensis]|uniref:Chromatin structure-remodeling complex protein rsc9 n=1 Tax=Neophaeococcomyces mojaviensis TaxID=3383035 RepID=A0ACC3AE20_9EURO|nr:Chromatin structure-remodeling complex protein rsc9 [Knufia sp. JES_112]